MIALLAAVAALVFSAVAVASTINGTDGNDTLTGTPGPDKINARKGDDTVNALAGKDRVKGGQGNDTLNAGEDNDKLLNGDAGNDTIDAGAGDDKVKAGKGDDTVDGGDGSDKLAGDKGDDTVNGGDGNDRIKGGKGVDHLNGDAGDDRLDGRGDGGTADTITCGDGDDDTVKADRNDTVSADCEHVKRSGHGKAKGPKPKPKPAKPKPKPAKPEGLKPDKPKAYKPRRSLKAIGVGLLLHSSFRRSGPACSKPADPGSSLAGDPAQKNTAAPIAASRTPIQKMALSASRCTDYRPCHQRADHDQRHADLPTPAHGDATPGRFEVAPSPHPVSLVCPNPEMSAIPPGMDMLR